jgi:hypothetical protein
MEHKQHPGAVSSFELVAVPTGPDPDEERLFVNMEAQHVDEVLRIKAKQGLVTRVLNGASGPTLEDWRHYRHKLGSYLNTLDRYEAALDQGVVPFRVAVTNVGNQKDFHIAIAVKVHDGQLLLTRQLPSRPPRPEGHQHTLEMPSYNVFSGFMRSNVRIGRTSMSAMFSELAAGDEAALVNQTLFIELTPETAMTYQLTTKNGGTVTGQIAL